MSEKSNIDIIYPCEFPIKAVGKSSDSFPETVFHLLKPVIDDLSWDNIETQASGKGNYMSVRIKFIAQSEAQIAEINQRLKNCEDVIFSI